MSLPAPYYEDEAVTIYHGDCREILPHLPKVDAVVTDPPYGINAGATAFGKSKTDGDLWDLSTQPELINAALGLAKHGIVWGGNYYQLPANACWLVWDKKNEVTTFADCELAWTNLAGPVRKFSWLWSGPYQERREYRSHPTQKPISLMRWCIGKLPDSAKVILDPFMGSGTTLRAAKDLGRKAIGIEIEEKYCEIAAKRMAQEVLPL